MNSIPVSNRLISFIVFGYNQEQYIRETATAALAQTYSPLEVILSDDGSEDRTFEIMCEVAKAYKGPHKVLLNRVESNRGLMHHINHAVRSAHGEWLVLNAGDDISHRDRTTILMKIAHNGGERVRAIFSDGQPFESADEAKPILDADLSAAPDPTSVQLVRRRRLLAGLGFIYAGATWAYHRDCFDKFDPLWEKLNTEDRVLPFRAFLLGEIAYVRTALMARRIAPNSLGQRNNSMQEIAPEDASRMEESTLDALLHDVNTAVERGVIAREQGAVLSSKMRATHQTHEYRRAHYRNIPRARLSEHLRALASICSRLDLVGIYQYLRMWAGLRLRPNRKRRYR
jgi:glycosyltransferase involved in cell wall biosynthesis